jgi:ferredoxin
MWRIDIDESRCVGSGMCAGLAPGHFDVHTGLAAGPDRPVEPDETVVAAAECCPMEAIRVTDAATGALLAGAGE